VHNALAPPAAATHGGHIPQQGWLIAVGIAVAVAGVIALTADRREPGLPLGGRVGRRRARRLIWSAVLGCGGAAAFVLGVDHVRHARVVASAVLGDETVQHELFWAAAGLAIIATAVLFAVGSLISVIIHPLPPPPPRFARRGQLPPQQTRGRRGRRNQPVSYMPPGYDPRGYPPGSLNYAPVPVQSGRRGRRS
jgi:MFS family permease